MYTGTRTVQAHLGSDSDSESRRQSALVGPSRRKECPLFNSAGAYSGGRLRRVYTEQGVILEGVCLSGAMGF